MQQYLDGLTTLVRLGEIAPKAALEAVVAGMKP
jgi:hypothetical protein